MTMGLSVGCKAGAHVSKSQLLFCVFGFAGFVVLALGVISDYWTTYGINSEPRLTQRSGTGSPSHTDSSGLVLAREGLWRVCYHYVSYNSNSSSTTIQGHMCYFGMSAPSPMSEAMSQGETTTRYEVGYLIATWVLFGLGVVVTLVAVVMSMAALRHKKNRLLIRGVAATFIIAVVLAFLGLVMCAVRNSRFYSQWPSGASPYSSASLGWSYGISWVGIPLCLVAGAGHLWFIRRYEDTMI